MSLDVVTVQRWRTEAMLDFDEGKLPEAESKLNDLIAGLGAPQTRQMKNELCQCWVDRASIRRLANRWEEALEDLAALEKLVPETSPVLQRSQRVNLYLLRAKIFATPHSTVYNLEAAQASLLALRNLGWISWIVEELESYLAFRGGDWPRAAELAIRVAQALAAEGWERGAMSCRSRAGEAYLELGDLQAAEIELRVAHAFFEKWGPPDSLAAAQLCLARLQSRLGEHDAAWDWAEKALNGFDSLIRNFRVLREQQIFLIDKLRYYDQAFDVGLAKGGVESWQRAWTIAERAKSFYLCQLVANADVTLFDGVDPERIENLRQLEAQLDACEQMLAAQDASRREALAAQLQALSQQRQVLFDRIMQENPRWAGLRVPPRFDLAAMLKQLDPKWIPLSYFWRKGRADAGATLFIFYADQQRAVQCATVFWSPPELALLEDCREQLRGQVTPFTPVFPRALVEKVLPQKVRETFAAGQCLLISPHESLRRVPLHAIADGTGPKKFWGNQWPMQYIPTLALLTLRRQDSPPQAVMLMGCADNAFQMSRLKEVESEIEALHGLWSVRPPYRVEKRLLPPQGSPAQSGLPIHAWRDFEILHFACHGQFPEDRPFDAALLLGADAIRASEFFTIRLRAKLVCFSACSLGRQARSHAGLDTSGDEWIGLYLPLFYSGAETMMVSLWDANSAVAATFMRSLHQALSEGLAPAPAFQKALQSVSLKPVPLWANWCLVGLPQ